MREIIISIVAQKKIEKLFDYLEGKWSERVRITFAKKLYNSVKIIRLNPESFPKSEINKKYHKFVVSKQTTILYTFTSKQINVVSIFDTRQNPSRIKKIK